MKKSIVLIEVTESEILDGKLIEGTEDTILACGTSSFITLVFVISNEDRAQELEDYLEPRGLHFGWKNIFVGKDYIHVRHLIKDHLMKYGTSEVLMGRTTTSEGEILLNSLKGTIHGEVK